MAKKPNTIVVYESPSDSLKAVVETIAHGNEEISIKVKKAFDILDVSEAIPKGIKDYFIDSSRICAIQMNAELLEIVKLLVLPTYVYGETASKKGLKLDKEYGRGFEKSIVEKASSFKKLFSRLSGTTSKTKREIDEEIAVRIVDEIKKDIIFRIGNDIDKEVKKYDDSEQHQLIHKAFNVAYMAHLDDIRDSGEPYIMHPISVAKILINEKLNSEIIAAALLHDVVEDNTRYTLDRIEKETNIRVRNMVDAVTQISAETKEFDRTKEDIDRETLDKLCSMVGSSKDDYMRYALFVKAADRIHNLRTIDCFDTVKQVKKVNETQGYLTLFRTYNVNKLADIIEDLCFKISNETLYNSIASSYANYLNENQKSKSLFDDALSKALNNVNSLIETTLNDKQRGFDFEILEAKLSPLDIYNIITKKIKNIDFSKIQRNINKNNIPLYKYFIILDAKDPISNITNAFLPTLIKAINYDFEFSKSGIIIDHIDYDEEQNYLYFSTEDELNSSFECRVFMRNDYNYYINGRDDVAFEKEVEQLDDLSESIMVYDRSGKSRRLPKGSSVIDFAFNVHSDLGETLYEAIVNDKKVDIFSELHPLDRVTVFAHAESDPDYRKHGKETMKPNWLIHVKTNTAQRHILHYIERQLYKR